MFKSSTLSAVHPYSTLFEQLLLTLAREGFTISNVEPVFAAAYKDSQTIYLILAQDHPELPGKMAQLFNMVSSAEVAVLGGSSESFKLVKKARPTITKGKIHLYHLSDDGQLERPDGTGPTLSALLENRASLSPVEPEVLERYINEGHQKTAAQAEEALSFQKVLDSRRPIATYALLGIIAVFFALEYVWGGSENIVTLVRMGALIRERALTGDWWRIFSCTFLHAGVMHFVFNSYVLLVLGTSLERILGSGRFIILYVASAIGGSLASTLFLKEGLSVGASGAVWGLLAAEAVLAYRPGGLIPQVAISGLKKAAMINLAINVVNSFRPQVDWAAHAGGGIIGALLLISGFLTLGLPKLAEIKPDEDTPEDKRPFFIVPAAVVLGVMLLVGGVMGPIKGQPWTLGSGPSFARQTLGDTGISMEIPKGLSQAKSELNEGKLDFVFGDFAMDPALVEVHSIELKPAILAAKLDEELTTLEAQLTTSPPKGAKLVGAPKRVQEGEVGYLFAKYRYDNGVIYERAFSVTTKRLYRVDLLVRPKSYKALYVGGAERMLRSIQTKNL